MRIYLGNQNSETSQIKIYRDTKAIELDKLPEPIAILPGNAQYYDEVDYLFYDVDYYYRIEVIDAAGQTIITGNQVKRLGIDVGPGPEELIIGDSKFGLFGVFDVHDYEPEIITVMKKISSFNHTNTKVMKYIRDGIISYIPCRIQAISGVNISSRFWLESVNSKPFFVNEEYKTLYQNNKQEFTIANSRKFDFHIPKLFDKDNTETDVKAYNHVTTPPGVSEVIDILRMISDAAWNVSWPEEYSLFRHYSCGITTTLATCENTSTTYGTTFTVNSSNNTEISKSGYSFTTTNGVNVIPVIEYHGAA